MSEEIDLTGDNSESSDNKADPDFVNEGDNSSEDTLQHAARKRRRQN